LAEERPALKFVMPFRTLPPGHSALSQFTGALESGASWTVASSVHDFSATVQSPTAFSGDCGDSGPLGLVLSVSDPRFTSERMKFYLARPASPPQIARRNHSVSSDFRLTDGQRKILEEVIDTQMRMTLPSVLAPRPEISNPKSQPRELPYHRRIREGD